MVHTISFRRKREKRTDYKKRLRLLMSRKPRLVVRITNTKIIAHIAKFEAKGDKNMVGLDSTYLHKKGWKYSLKNTPAAYLTGYALGKKAVATGITEAILDTGLKQPEQKGKIYAFLKGALEAGLQMPHDPSVLPGEKRLTGQHIAAHKQGNFSKYLKNNAAPDKISEAVTQLKSTL
tara:strand:- start:7 stop:537 length:531 start_codon:yes stop_codon:yes gene_type:complete